MSEFIINDTTTTTKVKIKDAERKRAEYAKGEEI